MEQVAGNPPGAEKNDISLEYSRVENDALEAIKTMFKVVPCDDNSCYCIGNG